MIVDNPISYDGVELALHLVKQLNQTRLQFGHNGESVKGRRALMHVVDEIMKLRKDLLERNKAWNNLLPDQIIPKEVRLEANRKMRAEDDKTLPPGPTDSGKVTQDEDGVPFLDDIFSN